MNNSGWILLDAAEHIFKTSRDRVYNSNDGKIHFISEYTYRCVIPTVYGHFFFFYKTVNIEFEPENCPKWDMLSEILRVEIPCDAKKAIESGRRSSNKPIVVLILCQDSRTCYQLNQYLTQGAERYLLFTAMKNDVQIKKLAESYKNVKESDINSIRLHGSRLQNETVCQVKLI